MKTLSKHKMVFTIWIFILFMASGCSVNKAINQPSKKDVSVLERGTPRFHVIAELGQPVSTELSENNTIIDTFYFIQGYSSGVKAARAVGHTIMDVATLGMWEVVGTPAELIADGDKVVVRVMYDQTKLVDKVIPIQGEDEIPK